MADLPRGTVTFLLTDIESSTALWEHDRTAMLAAVDQHPTALREAIAAHEPRDSACLALAFGAS
jgi:class 3 adenylate cyclase